MLPLSDISDFNCLHLTEAVSTKFLVILNIQFSINLQIKKLFDLLQLKQTNDKVNNLDEYLDWVGFKGEIFWQTTNVI